jgi:hypothetical protein
VPRSAGAGFAARAGWLAGLAVVASGLSADSSAQYCSSESDSHSPLGQSSSSSRLLLCCRDRLLPGAAADAAFRPEPERSRAPG